jgi:hypothetical protein
MLKQEVVEFLRSASRDLERNQRMSPAYNIQNPEIRR